MENPSAFPEIRTGYDDSRHKYDGNVYSEGGMSLRDYFAAAALQGMLGGVPGPHLNFENAAKEAYMHADAMLKARQGH